MLRIASWISLLLGVLILLAVALNLLDFTRTMARFGGIIWSMDVLRLNILWVVALAIGMILVMGAGCGFAWDRRRRD